MTPLLAIIPILTSSLLLGSLSSPRQYVLDLSINNVPKNCSLSITVKERGTDVSCYGFTQKLPEDTTIKIGDNLINVKLK